MNRRTLLSMFASGVVLGSGGCLQRGSNSDSSANMNGVQNKERDVELTRVKSVPDESQIQIGVELVKDTVDPNSTARLEVSTTNIKGTKEISVGEDGCAILNREDQASDPPGVWLKRADPEKEQENTDGLWITENLPESTEGFGGYGCDTRMYDTDETIGTNYSVWADNREESYLSPGKYSWETSIRVGGLDDRDTEYTFDWGFTMEISKT